MIINHRTEEVMLKTASKVLGEDVVALGQFSVKARQKVRTLFTLLLIPAALWFVSAFSAARKIFEVESLWGATLAGLAAAGLIFVVDLSFMRCCADKAARRYRLMIVLLSCSLGSLCLDSVLFHDDISATAKTLQSDRVEKAFEKTHPNLLGDIVNLENEIADERMREQKLEAAFHAEMDGSGGTGYHGVGKVAREKKASWESSRQKLEVLNADLASLYQKRDTKFDKTKSESPVNGGFLTTIEAMFLTLSKSTEMLVVWVALFLFIILLEYSPLFVKSRFGETDYDQWKTFQEQEKKLALDIKRLECQRLFERISRYSDADTEAVELLRKHQLN